MSDGSRRMQRRFEIVWKLSKGFYSSGMSKKSGVESRPFERPTCYQGIQEIYCVI
jgi:hypothetical protein